MHFWTCKEVRYLWSGAYRKCDRNHQGPLAKISFLNFSRNNVFLRTHGTLRFWVPKRAPWVGGILIYCREYTSNFVFVSFLGKCAYITSRIVKYRFRLQKGIKITIRILIWVFNHQIFFICVCNSDSWTNFLNLTTWTRMSSFAAVFGRFFLSRSANHSNSFRKEFWYLEISTC